jgi:hypothetical protein
MLYDVRTYTCRPGTLKKHLALYAEHGYDVQRRHLGEPLAYLQTETGNVNSYTHIWVFADAAGYLEKSAQAAYLVSQDTRLMVPTPFFRP